MMQRTRQFRLGIVAVLAAFCLTVTLLSQRSPTLENALQDDLGFSVKVLKMDERLKRGSGATSLISDRAIITHVTDNDEQRVAVAFRDARLPRRGEKELAFGPWHIEYSKLANTEPRLVEIDELVRWANDKELQSIREEHRSKTHLGLEEGIQQVVEANETFR